MWPNTGSLLRKIPVVTKINVFTVEQRMQRYGIALHAKLITLLYLGTIKLQWDCHHGYVVIKIVFNEDIQGASQLNKSMHRVIKCLNVIQCVCI